MPNRILKESICTSEELSALTAEAEVLFYRLIVKADDFGLFFANAKIVNSYCFPLKSHKEVQVQGWIRELEAAGLIATYMGEDRKRYIKIMSWDKHQTRRAEKSKYPAPIKDEAPCKQLQADASNGKQLHADENICEQPQADVHVFDNVFDNVFDKRYNARQQQKDYASEFEMFWQAYPRKTEKQKAYRTWNARCKEGLTTDGLVMAAKNYAAFCRSRGTEQNYIKHPSTFLGPDRVYLDWTEARKEEKDAAYISDAEDSASRARYPVPRVVNGTEYPI